MEQKKKIAKANQHSECFICKCCGIFGAWSGLKCCCCHFNNEQPFLSIKTERHCTDIPCCWLFLVAILGQLGLVIYAVVTLEADPRWYAQLITLKHSHIMSTYRLVYYSDYNGTLCAPDVDFDPFALELDLDFSNITFEGNYAAWPDVRMYDIRICVEHCNDTLDDDRMVTPAFDANITDVGIDPSTGVTFDISGYRSINIFEAICIPDPSYSDVISDILGADFEDFEDNLNTAADKIALAINDARTAWMLFCIWYLLSAFPFHILAHMIHSTVL